MAAYVAYGVHAEWKTHDGREMPKWADLPEATRAHWHAGVIGLFEAVNGTADLVQQERLMAAEIAVAGLFADAKYLVWSNAHGGWWHVSRHGYTTDLTHAARFSLSEAQDIVMKAGADALDPRAKALPEMAVLAPEERWDTPPQTADGGT